MSCPRFVHCLLIGKQYAAYLEKVPWKSGRRKLGVAEEAAMQRKVIVRAAQSPGEPKRN